MAQKAEYRSSVRSRRMIKDAFIELLQTKSLDKITVTDIVEKADLNRGTFYAHYVNLEGLIQAIEEETVETLYGLLDGVQGRNFFSEPLPMFLKISEYLEENKELLLSLLRSRSAFSFIIQLPEMIAEQLASSDNIDEEIRKSESFKAKCRFYAGGEYSLYMAWFQGNLSGSLKDVAYLLESIITEQNKQ